MRKKSSRTKESWLSQWLPRSPKIGHRPAHLPEQACIWGIVRPAHNSDYPFWEGLSICDRKIWPRIRPPQWYPKGRTVSCPSAKDLRFETFQPQPSPRAGA